MLITIADSLGYSSRTLYLLLNNSISSDSGRNSIISDYMEMVRNGPVFGYGLAGGWTSSGMYPHNIFVELLLAFGPVLGILLSSLVVLVCCFGAIAKKENDRRVAHILLAYSVSLLVSDSFLMCPMFFMLFAIGLQSSPKRIVFGNGNRSM